MRYIVGPEPLRGDRQEADGRGPAAAVSSSRSPARWTSPTRHDVLHRDLKPREHPDRRVGPRRTSPTSAWPRSSNDGHRRRPAPTIGWGRPPYMAPEQVARPRPRAGVDSDVYSLGATLYEALTGRPPFRAENPLEIYRQMLDVEPTRPRHAQPPRCDRDLETICLKCLEKEPGRRYASALQLAEDLRRFRDRTPILARRVGPVERLRKLAQAAPDGRGPGGRLGASRRWPSAGVYPDAADERLLDRYEMRAGPAVDTLVQFGETPPGRPARPAQARRYMIVLGYYEDFLDRSAARPGARRRAWPRPSPAWPG